MPESEPGEDARPTELALKKSGHADEQDERGGEDSLPGASPRESEGALEVGGREKVAQGEQEGPWGGAVGKLCTVAGPLRRRGVW